MTEARTSIIYNSFGTTMYQKQQHFIVNIACFPTIFVVTLYTALITVSVEDICIETFLKVSRHFFLSFKITINYTHTLGQTPLNV